MTKPTDAQIDQAAETLARMAEIPGLERGIAIFKNDFKRVEWYTPLWKISDFAEFPYDVEARIPWASSYDSRAELFEVCRWEVEEGLYDRDAQVTRMLPFIFDYMKEAKEGKRPEGTRTPDDLRQMVALLDDEVAVRQWRERIDAEWPLLSAVPTNGGER
jgi:hypothetical protein